MKKDKGLFVFALADMNSSTNHCIGIDCEVNMTYDAVDLKVKWLTRKNIECSTCVYDDNITVLKLLQNEVNHK